MVRTGLQIADARKHQRAYQEVGQGRNGTQMPGGNVSLKRSRIPHKSDSTFFFAGSVLVFVREQLPP